MLIMSSKPKTFFKNLITGFNVEIGTGFEIQIALVSSIILYYTIAQGLFEFVAMDLKDPIV